MTAIRHGGAGVARRLAACLRRAGRDESGTASVEFALMFPVLMYFFMMAAEMGVIQLRQSMIERGMDVVVRQLRLGDTTLRDPDELKRAVCAELFVMPDCERDLMLEMSPIDVAAFRYGEGSMRCVDRREESNPVTTYNAGADNQMMLLRFCILHDPLFPSWGLGEVLPKEDGGGFPLIASTIFVNEPS